MTHLVPPAKLKPEARPSTADQVWRHSGNVKAVSTLQRGKELFLILKPLPGEGIMELFSRLRVAVGEWDAAIIHLRVFGSIHAKKAGMDALRGLFDHIDWPITWVEGSACNEQPIAGLQVFCHTGGEVIRIRIDGRVVGSVFNDGEARYCLLGGLGPDRNDLSRGGQTKETLDKMSKALAEGSFTLADTVRTWFFLDDILSWYDEFNQARNEIYSGVKFRTGSLPASTGVGAKNQAHGAVVVGAWAMQPLKSTASAVEIASPLQCPAPAYGSSFSRAMEISTSAGRRLLISGTASIAPAGETQWVGDACQQVAQSMEVVGAILRSRGYEFSNLSRATAYFKHRADARFFTEWCAGHGVQSERVAIVQCDICRDDLLFELEADAWSSNPQSTAV